MKAALLAALGFFALAYTLVWGLFLLRNRKLGERSDSIADGNVQLRPQLAIGFATNFMDALGVGAFAPTTSVYKLLHLVSDDLIPGTINVGGVLPVILEGFIFIAIVVVDIRTLVSMIVAAILGAWFGAGLVCGWPKRKIQIGLGLALLAAALLTLGAQLKLYPSGGSALGLTGARLWVAVSGNFMFAACMQLGVGLYAPCMILLYLLGLNPRAAFPIMMGSCAFLMPIGSYRFIRSGRYSAKAAVALTLAGIPAILLAANVVKSLPLGAIRWLVVFVASYTAVALLRSAAKGASNALKPPEAGQRSCERQWAGE